MAKLLRTDERVVALLERAAVAGNGEAPGWFADLRARAASSLRVTGLPNRRWESWKYTDPDRMLRTGFAPAAPLQALPAALSEGLIPPEDSHRIAVVNGRVSDDRSGLAKLPPGVSVRNLAEAVASDGATLSRRLGTLVPFEMAPFAALNTAGLEDVLVIELSPGAVVERPIEVVVAGVDEGGPVIAQPRILIVAGEGAQATVVESHRGTAQLWTNAVTEVFVDPAAVLRHVVIGEWEGSAYHTGLCAVRLGHGARYEGIGVSTGARLARHEIRVAVEGAGAGCRLSGVALGRDSQHIDNTTFVDHRVGGSWCEETYKSVLDDRARAVFQGLIRVAPGAQKTDARQINRSILLSPLARAEAKPELEIHADDVKCAHGATVGELDADALFYLRARGIPLNEARGLLIRAFVGEILDEVTPVALCERLLRVIDGWWRPDDADRQAA